MGGVICSCKESTRLSSRGGIKALLFPVRTWFETTWHPRQQ